MLVPYPHAEAVEPEDEEVVPDELPELLDDVLPDEPLDELERALAMAAASVALTRLACAERIADAVAFLFVLEASAPWQLEHFAA